MLHYAAWANIKPRMGVEGSKFSFCNNGNNNNNNSNQKKILSDPVWFCRVVIPWRFNSLKFFERFEHCGYDFFILVKELTF